MTSLLISRDCYIETDAQEIKFKKKIRQSLHRAENVRQGLVNLREGEINLKKNGENEIKIGYEVNLNPLIFKAILFGLIVGIIFELLTYPNYLNTLIIGLLTCILLFVINYNMLVNEINKIIDQSSKYD